MRWLLPFCVAVISVSGTPLFAGPRILSARDPSAGEVLAVAADFTARIAEGDRNGAYELFAGSGDDRKVLEAEFKFVDVSDALFKTLAGRFPGHDSQLKQSFARVLLRQLSERIGHEGVVLDGDAACTGIGVMINAGLELHRYDGRWKVLHVSADPTRTSNLLAFYTATADLMDGIRVKTEAGKLSTLDAAAKELDDRMFALTSGNFWAAKGPFPASTQPADRLPPGLQNTEEISNRLGASINSPEMIAIFNSMPPLPRLADFRDAGYISSYELGISLSFHVPGGNLQAIHLFAEGNDGYRQYRGLLPHRLTLAMNRGEVEARLGRPNKVGPGYAYYPRLGLAITYASQDSQDFRNPDNRIANLTLTHPVLDAPPPAPLPRGAPPWLTFRLESDQPGGDVVAFPSDPSGTKLMFLARDVVFDETSVDTLILFSPDMTKDKRWHLDMKLMPEAGRRLTEVSRANTGRRMAMVLDGRVIVAPVIREKIADRLTIDLGANAGEEAYRKVADEIGTALYSLPPTTRPVRLGPE